MLEHSSNKLNINRYKVETYSSQPYPYTSLTMLYHFIPACCEVDSPHCCSHNVHTMTLKPLDM